MNPALVERIRRMYEADSLGVGLPRFLELAHPDIELVLARDWVDMERAFRGRDEARAYFEGLDEAFERFRYELIELDEHGEALLAEVVVKAQGRESGIATTTPVVQVIWIEDGLIRRIEGYLNRDDALRKLDLGTGPDAHPHG